MLEEFFIRLCGEISVKLLNRYALLPLILLGGISAQADKTASRFVSRSVVDLAGKICRLPDPNAKATALIFIAHDCPVANSYAPEIQRIAARYTHQRVTFFVVYAEPGLTAVQAQAHSKAYGYRLSALHNGWQALARAVGADVSPEAIILTPDGVIRYRGRIDDLYVTFGVSRLHARTHDLRDALEAVLHGRPVRTAQTRAVGCFLATNG